MKKKFLLLLFLVLTGTACPQSVEKGPYTIYPIGDGIWHIEDATAGRPGGMTTGKDGKTTMNNCSDMYLVVGIDRALLIDLSNFLKYDTSAAESLRSIVYERAGTRELHITVTHLHGDHLGMLPAFKDDPKAKFWIPGAEFAGMDIFPKERTSYFEGGSFLDLGGTVISTTEVPGHTDHSTVFFVNGKNIVFTGDALGSGSGVWLFNYDCFVKYTSGVDKLIRYVEDPLNEVDRTKLVIYGGHYWQKGEVENLGAWYIYDMKSLIEKIKTGSADAVPYNSGRAYLDTNFRYNSATITWNKADAEKYVNSLK